MRILKLYIAASLDGYIARLDDSIDWLENPEYTIEGQDYGYQNLLKSIDTTLMGYATYKVILGFDMPFHYADKTNYVFTRTAGRPASEHVSFIHEDPTDFVKSLKQKPGKDIWLIGGGQINTLLLNAGLIDEIYLTTLPIILGEGVPLFADGKQETKLELLRCETFPNGFIQAVYKPVTKDG